ncbi:protein tiptop-like isoform X2 [Limulus polyphemus]|nr:protein tiptop-like isoform X2 [Limulus polyphemus]XP_022238085.1 protein tiptop-like isoform X2 [Limulus polyphemus]XP_022238086.1 protein tiptop-like isoform X2 [Limulus polyphemus]
MADGESLSSDCDVVEEQNINHELAERTDLDHQNHFNDATLPLVHPDELNTNEAKSGTYSSRETRLYSAQSLTNSHQSKIYPIVNCNNFAIETMMDDGPIDFSFRNQNQCFPMASSLSPGSPINGFPPESQNEPLDLSTPNRRKNTAKYPRESKLTRVDNLFHVSPQRECLNRLTWNGKLMSFESSKISEVSSATSYNVSHKSVESLKSQVLNTSLITSNMATAFEKMNELCHTVTKPQGYRTGSRKNPWQNQWINKSEEQAKDVFTCVWCKQSFKSLGEMTIHIQKSPKCGMTGIQTSAPSTSSNTSISSEDPSSVPKCSSSNNGSSLLMKESMALPRKLVRGQDVWLGKGAEQTRQILKCMWCGQSFKTLADMTNHMRVTQHYNNIISQEQIISWKVPADKMTSQSQINAVLTCKVCNQVFGSLKELSYHMMKNAHYKEHILRTITESGGRRRQTRERRKKSLPVKKLLELERMEMNNLNLPKERNERPVSNSEKVSGKITCEECAEKVDAKDFVIHIKNCTQNSKSYDLLKTYFIAESAVDQVKKDSESGTPEKIESDEEVTKSSRPRVTKTPIFKSSEKDTIREKEQKYPSAGGTNKGNESTSVLNAIEKLIEKSFQNRSKMTSNGSTGILQRLGIDEEVYPPWHSSGKGAIDSSSKSRMSSVTTPPLGLPGKKIVDIKNGTFRSRDAADAFNNKFPKGNSSINKEKIIFDTKSDVSGLSSLPYKKQPSPQSVKSETYFNSSTTIVSKTGQTLSQETFNEAVEEDSGYFPSKRQVEKSPVRSVRSKSPAFDHGEDSLDAYSEVDESNGESSAYEMVEELCDVSRSLSQTNIFKHLEDAASPGDSLQNKGKSSPSSLSNSSKLSATDLNHELDKNHIDYDKPFTGHPLRELQKLLDKTDVSVSSSAVQTPPGSILSFSWACNEPTTSDSLMKCAFCDTNFVSKGAYRHHMSKMHFAKDTSSPDAFVWKATPPSGDKAFNENNLVTKESPPFSETSDESPHSKFLKYTELAKELSKKYV